MIVTKDDHVDIFAKDCLSASRLEAPAGLISGLSGAIPFPGALCRPIPSSPAAVPLSIQNSPESVRKASGPLNEPHTPTRLLIVDADTARGDQLARTLAIRYDVDIVNDSETALIAVLAYSPDILLVDLALLRQRHFQILHSMKAGAGPCHIPVIAIAAGAGEDDLNEGMEAGVDDFLVNPFSHGELFARIATVRARRTEAEEQRNGEARYRVLLEKVKDEFIAMLAHELRNPLAPIRNAVRVLREPQLAIPELQWARDVIDRQVTHMSRLLEDLLDVSRVTHGTLMLRRTPMNLMAAIEQAVETSRPLISFRRHTLHQAMPGEPLMIEGDLSRLVQVFSNLLNNAAKYTSNGGNIDLIVEAEADEAVVRVRDNGRGIPPELLPHIFEALTQDDRLLDRTQGGLGLALVRRLVDMHGGRVEAHSDGPGCGAEFVVRLPRLPFAAPAESTGAEGGPAPRPAALRILVVDDNVDSAESMALLLGLDGHEVRTAFDGQSALAEAVEFQPRAVLLDIGLPGMDGYEVARRMRELPGLRNVLMIAITGYGQEDDRTRSKAAGFDHHLVKPVDPEALSRLLGTLVQA